MNPQDPEPDAPWDEDADLRQPTPIAGWAEIQRRAAAGIDQRMRSALLDVGRSTWGPRQGRDWEIVASLDEASWRIYRHSGRSAGRGFLTQQLGIRATVAPDGRVVALQVDNGDEFLALADTSDESLRRGLQHLVSKGLPIRELAQAPFGRRWDLWHRVRALFAR